MGWFAVCLLQGAALRMASFRDMTVVADVEVFNHTSTSLRRFRVPVDAVVAQVGHQLHACNACREHAIMRFSWMLIGR